MWKPGRHTLIIAQPRAGKTSFLLFATASFLKLGEIVIVRDIGEFFEWFSMLDHGYKILGHVPEECSILYEHTNFEQIEFDATDLNTLFNHFEQERINLVFFESFCLEVRNYIRFWSTFFKTLLPWKQQPGHGSIPFSLICDEFGDLAPGKGRTYIPGQNQVSQLIAMNHRKFRRHNIRLVAAVHYFRDITPPIRERFDCYVIKKNYPNPKEVPYTLQNYSKLFPKLAIDRMLFVDSSKNFNEFEIREEIKPQRFFNISVRGNVDKLMRRTTPESTWEKRAKMWRRTTVRLIHHVLEEKKMTGPEIAEVTGMKLDNVYSYNSFLKRGTRRI
jgi:hypothetical protein